MLLPQDKGTTVPARSLQSEGPAEGRCSCTALRKATRRISQLYDTALAPSGLKTTQHAILAHIHRLGTASVGELANALVMDAGALAHSLKPLQRDDFVEVLPNKQDKRSRDIRLTRRGRTKLAETDALWQRAQAAFDRSFGSAESAALRRAMALLASDGFGEELDKRMEGA
jgi:DNA-binding MarR family transcriptional regulator